MLHPLPDLMSVYKPTGFFPVFLLEINLDQFFSARIPTPRQRQAVLAIRKRMNRNSLKQVKVYRKIAPRHLNK